MYELARGYHGGMHGGWSIWWVLGTILFWAVLITAAVLGGRWLLRNYRRQPGGPTPEQVLGDRFARGEIDAEEYRDRLAVLRGGAPGA